MALDARREPTFIARLSLAAPTSSTAAERPSAWAPADIVSLDPVHPALVARAGDAILDSLVFAGRKDMVDCVWRAGAKLVTNGRHHRRAEIAGRYRQALEYVLA